jgi:hypothetical protein
MIELIGADKFWARVPHKKNKKERVGFEIFTAMTMKNAVFLDVALCRSCVNRRFGENCRLHLQGKKIRC